MRFKVTNADCSSVLPTCALYNIRQLQQIILSYTDKPRRIDKKTIVLARHRRKKPRLEQHRIFKGNFLIIFAVIQSLKTTTNQYETFDKNFVQLNILKIIY